MRLAARTRLYSLCEEMTVHDHVTTEHGDSASLPHSSTNTQIAFNRERQLNYARLLQYNACYEAMPTSSKMVVFDTQLTLKKAFNGLIYQNTRHVLLSDSEKDGAIVGLLSVTDFIRVMLRLYKNLKDLEKKTHESEGMEFSSSLASTTDDGIHTLSEDDIGRLTLKEYRELIQTEGKLNDLVYINADEW
ncbi:hypothetical protein AB6A40_004163 [Gnathostoma spinigerum]|uniref:CBS domain-containing protein n=1 Tax=Gnathostoma spinigerum TaxID=75299 RepID=A0ABD6EH32_9BILA